MTLCWIIIGLLSFCLCWDMFSVLARFPELGVRVKRGGAEQPGEELFGELPRGRKDGCEARSETRPRGLVCKQMSLMKRLHEAVAFTARSTGRPKTFWTFLHQLTLDVSV